MKFEWDEKKQRINIQKHGIDFEEAKTVFYDEEALLIPDPEHSSSEERFVILGISKKTNCYDHSGVEITWDKTKPRNEQWDMGHLPNQKYSKNHQKYINGEITLDEFKAWYQDPANYRPELPSANRSHRFE